MIREIGANPESVNNGILESIQSEIPIRTNIVEAVDRKTPRDASITKVIKIVSAVVNGCYERLTNAERTRMNETVASQNVIHWKTNKSEIHIGTNGARTADIEIVACRMANAKIAIDDRIDTKIMATRIASATLQRDAAIA